MDNEYTVDIEDILHSYAIEAECLYVVHNKNYLLYRKRGNFFTIPVIIFSTVTGLLSFNQPIQNTTEGQYIIGSLNILTGIISTIYKFLDYSNFENQHKLLAIEYLHLFEEIRSTLQKDPKNRPKALMFLGIIEKKRQGLLENFPIINDHIKNNFKRSHKKLSLPLRLNHISKIHIFGRRTNDAVSDVNSSSECSSEQQVKEDHDHLHPVNNVETII